MVIQQLRDSIFLRVIWGVLGLYLLNFSVDIQDPNPQYVAEDLSINDQESIIEIVVEQLLGYENAIDEYDDYDGENCKSGKSNHAVDLTLITKQDNDLSDWTKLERNYPTHLTQQISYGYAKLDVPPPKV